MLATGRRFIAAIAVSLMLLPAAEPGNAQPHHQAALSGLGPNSKTTLIVAVLVTTVGLIGTGVYLGIRQAHTVKGCVANGPDGPELRTQDNVFVLLGNTADIKPGQRFKLNGSKKKRLAGVSDRPSFVVEKVNKTYGACLTTSP